MGISPPIFTGSNPGLVPVSDGSTAKFLRGDGSFAAAGGGGGGSAQATVALTSGAVPVNVPINVATQFLTVDITSGGTAGTEKVVVPYPTLDANNYNAEFVGYSVFLYLDVQTNGADSVQICIIDDTGTTIRVQGFNAQGFDRYDPLLLDYQGAFVQMIWNGNDWEIANGSVYGFAFNFDGTPIFQANSVVKGGDTSIINIQAGNLVLQGGTGNMAGTGSKGGDVVLSPGGGFNFGHIIMQYVPTSSAGLTSGMIWNNAGVLNIIP